MDGKDYIDNPLYFINPWDWDEPTKVISPEEAKKIFNDKKKDCFHDWITYTGLNEVFEHCKNCHEKKPVK